MTAPTAEQRERLRKAWGFCDNLHGWDAPCAQCQSLAQALAAEYARGRNAGLEEAEREFDAWLSWVPKREQLEHAAAIGLKGYLPQGGDPAKFKLRIRALAAQDEKEGERGPR